ncbi:hypothetical protein TMatcc_010189 [Talaromyces marneffei ATCC 18224]|uniref:Uncharacterized protein n=3 Tax=Talaromyces marneffei TaxID=37727 RepID=B6QWC5_TALMQ|nr:uncharacterized protein EYB26_010001 [Talaromyces marneffei]EEA19253.1 hypothetical protein PMAA_015110 [Talaromyces marneffei ATCC 18224]KAE8548945.1 hypothetical protein EYB25_009328 [Talaromyces marneffei]QGA22285.1 hypothetical protein EYB26_010001 [Talaromyces marneffei]
MDTINSTITSTTYQLLRQSVIQAPEFFPVDSDELFVKAGVEKKFRTFHEKDLNVPSGTSMKVAVAYPTDKKPKIAPLREKTMSYIKQLERERGLSIQITEFFFKVKDTGVGEQPLHPEGFVGALNRIYYIQDSLLGNRKWEQATFTQPAIQDFCRIIIPSLESDLYRNPEWMYDKPNVIFYECMTGHFVAGMGTGPCVEEDILQLAQRLGVAFFDDPGAVTYGKMLQALFPQSKIDHADWHGVVCRHPGTGEERDRASFIKELCEALSRELAEFCEKVFKKML